MLNTTDIKVMVSKGEGFNVEFKAQVPLKVRDIAEEICAFANAAGGYVLIGVNDKNKVLGVDIDNRSRSAIQNAISDISPSVHTEIYPVEVDDKTVWVIDVSSGRNKPYMFSGALYIREGSNTQKMTTAEEVRSFFQQNECVFFDEAPCRKFDITRDLDNEFVAEFKMLAGYHQEITTEHLFNNLKLYTDDGHFKNGAVLFFSKRPDDLLDSAFVRCVLFDGVDKRYIADDKRMHGPLFKQYEQALAWLKKHLKVRYDIEGQGGRPRKELWEIPEVAMKEALINALAHRDYYDKGARIVVELYDDRLVVTNPGGLVSSIPPEKFGTISRSRNPLVFGLMERIRMVEQIGSGVMRMRKAMKEAELAQPDFGLRGSFSITLDKQHGEFFNEPEPIVEKIELSDIQNKALALIKANGSITINELGDALSINFRKAQRIVKYLREKEYIERDGGKKIGTWIVTEKSGMLNGTLSGTLSGILNGTLNNVENVPENNVSLSEAPQNERHIEAKEKNGLSEIQSKALAIIKTNGSITISKLGEILSVSFRQARRIVKHLKDNDYIKREGSDKKGIWIVNVPVNDKNVPVNDKNVPVSGTLNVPVNY